tara:strand:+ start:312 stop:506 length:195 start_codon:yes stop_codon:yes gene_type:complete
MNNIRQQRVKEQAEAYVRQLRRIPQPEALRVMEGLLGELFTLRDAHYNERVYLEQNSCSTDQKS